MNKMCSGAIFARMGYGDYPRQKRREPCQGNSLQRCVDFILNGKLKKSYLCILASEMYRLIETVGPISEAEHWEVLQSEQDQTTFCKCGNI